MSKYRQAARVDENQTEVVEQLEKMGYSVQVGHDDILVGKNGNTYWYELKDPAKTLKKDGAYKAGAIKKSQKDLARNWSGHYKIVHSIQQIIDDIKNQEW